MIISASLLLSSGCTSVLDLLQDEECFWASYPTIEWNEDNPKATILQLETYLQRLEKRIVISGGRELEWNDVCRRCYWVNTFVVSEPGISDKRMYEFTYLPDAEENNQQRRLIDKEVKDIVSSIPQYADEWESVLCVHDELISRVRYTSTEDADKSNSHIYDLYGALVNHEAVCQGYVYAMDYILDELGIKYEDVVSDTHIWSRLPDIDGSEKYIDVTWDDIDEVDKFGKPYILHNCMYITAEEMSLLSEHEVSKELPADGNSTGSNYFRANGGIVRAGETNLVSQEIERQIETGVNLVQLRFERKFDYDEVHDNIKEYVYSTDYSGSFVIWNDDDLLILSIGLYFKE